MKNVPITEINDFQGALNPLYIFDLDGTLSNPEHRRHWVEKANPTRDDWHRFYLDCINDSVNIPVMTTLMALYERGCEIQIWSGRDEMTRELTITWLQAAMFSSRTTVEQLLVHMRPHDDTTPDHQLKRAWLNQMSKMDRARLVAVFDDRQKVVDMWRDEGIACFQVAPGDF
jgi:hypothetical protein